MACSRVHVPATTSECACASISAARYKELARELESDLVGMIFQLCLCILLIGEAVGHAHFNPLDELHYERARVELGNNS